VSFREEIIVLERERKREKERGGWQKPRAMKCKGNKY
jgi:hypothetical protein